MIRKTFKKLFLLMTSLILGGGVLYISANIDINSYLPKFSPKNTVKNQADKYEGNVSKNYYICILAICDVNQP